MPYRLPALQRNLFYLFQMDSWDNGIDQEVPSWFQHAPLKRDHNTFIFSWIRSYYLLPSKPSLWSSWGQDLKVIFCYCRFWDCVSFFCLYRSKPWGWKGSRNWSRCPVHRRREVSRNLGGDEVFLNMGKCLLLWGQLQGGVSVLHTMKKRHFPYRCTS